MLKDQFVQITLMIAEQSMDVAVVAISGQEAMNEAYSFTIDVISNDSRLDLTTLVKSTAYLRFGSAEGIHGNIISASQLYAGKGLSLYRIDIGPRLMALQQKRGQRVFRDLSVPQIIVRLLDEHGFNNRDYRFEPLTGFYPARKVCMPHDENDLQFLQRLCVEEGIHFHFEHQPGSHALVLADDPASFPQLSNSIRFVSGDQSALHLPGISYLAERWALEPTEPQMTPADASAQATPEACDASEAMHAARLATEQPTQQRQASMRTLERERGERRTVLGLSNDAGLQTGRIIQVLDHPEQRFNDQWLVRAVSHVAKQPQVLQGLDAQDASTISSLLAAPSAPPQYVGKTCKIEPFNSGYRNSFRVQPWEMPFRPARLPVEPFASRIEQMNSLDTQNTTLPGTGLHLQVQGSEPLTVSTAQATVELSPERITLSSPVARLIEQPQPLPAARPAGALFVTDLRLTSQPGLCGEPLADLLWYIVRMPTPGMEFLTRLEPEHFLFEGRTDAKGYLGLSRQQLGELAAEYRATPQSLCIVHPGHCIILQDWLEQNWTPQQRLAFVQKR